jgi:hypothetical protein
MSHLLVHPLGLPKGSIRAILALIIVIIACQQMLNGAVPNLLLSETLMIVLTHYFTARQHNSDDHKINVINKPVVETIRLNEPNPLWLPRGSIRILIVTAFIITVLGLIEQGRLFDSNVLGMLIPFAAYLLGSLLKRNKTINADYSNSWFMQILIHITALIAILIGFLLLFLAFNNLLSTLPEWIASLLLSAILYYFGSR